jgi:Ca-activated chloride channel family protein
MSQRALWALGLCVSFGYGCSKAEVAQSGAQPKPSKYEEERAGVAALEPAPPPAVSAMNGAGSAGIAPLDEWAGKDAKVAQAPAKTRGGESTPTVQAGPSGLLKGGGGAVASADVLGGDPGHGGLMNVAPVQKLDPNARYATTYRPGGAALSAFDAAVSRGAIPAAYKDLVGDFGGRYAPAISVPDKAALAIAVDQERAVLAPDGGKLNLRIALRSSADTPSRAPLSVHLVLDVSGSMQGAAIDNAKSAAQRLVERLDAGDDFSMVTFSSDAQVLVPDGPVGARRSNILSKIREVHAQGGTNISAGLDLGYTQAHSKGISEEAVKIVMFLSDGHANNGDTNAKSITERSERAFQDGIQTSSFGLGADFDASLMSQIADKGAGGYYYLADSSQIASALTKELDSRLVPVAQGVEVRVRLRPDVSPVRVFGSRMLDGAEASAVRTQEVAMDKNVAKHDGIKRDRQSDAEGGMRFFMPAFARDDRHAMLITLDVPPGTGPRTLGSVEIRYKDRLQKKNVTEELAIKTKYGASEAESAASRNASVVATVQAFTAGDTILRAVQSVDAGDRHAAAALLRERADLMRRASEQLNEPRLLEDGQRLARLADATSGKDQESDPLPLAVLLRGSGYGYLR